MAPKRRSYYEATTHLKADLVMRQHATYHVPRTTYHVPRTTYHAPRATRHAPRATRHAPRATPALPLLVLPRYSIQDAAPSDVYSDD